MTLNSLSLSVILLCVISTSSNAQDWPNLQRYQKENEALPVLQPDEKRVVFMGNSITEGWAHLHPEFFKDNNYVNRGIGGQTTPQMLIRFRQDVIHLGPAAVVILAGVNDIAENTGPSTLYMTFDNIVSMTELAKANNIKVILCSLLPAYDFPWRPGLEPAEKVMQLNTMLKDYAMENNITYVDYFTPMANNANGLKEELGDDGIHPNLQGYLIMEPLVQDAITQVLSEL